MNGPSIGAPPRAFWCRTPSRANFGDALTPWLIQRLSGRYPRFAWPDDLATKYFVSGSIVALSGPRCIVWGSGVMNADDAVSPAACFLAVRGPRTRARAHACGADCPHVLGDPALLLPRLLPRAARQCDVGLVAHFADRSLLDVGWIEADGVKLIDIQQSVEDVVEQITGCEWLMSSSLHGLIVAHAYGVPAVRIKLRELPSGDGSKFADHYESLGVDAPSPIVLLPPEPLDLRTIERAAWCPPAVDTDALWRSCPFLDSRSNER